MEKVITKIIMGLLMLTASLAFTACGDDKDEAAGNLAEQIVGEWRVSQTNNDWVNEGDEFTFLSPGIVNWKDSGGDLWLGSYSLNGNFLSMEFKLGEDEKIGLDGNVSNEGKTLSFRFACSYECNGEYEYDYTLVSVLEKQE